MRRHWLIFAATLSAGLLAQRALADAQPTTPASPAPAPEVTPAPAPAKSADATKPSGEKEAEKKSEATTPADKEVSITPGPALVTGSNVNVRGQAKLNSEIVARLNTGDKVTVLEEITLKDPRPDEPSKWAKITFPAGAHVWVHASFIDPANKTVIPARLNVRTGPGENYSIAGILKLGEVVKQISVKEGWIEIEPPADAYAFIAAQYLKAETPAEPAAPLVAVTPPVTPAVPEAPAESQPVPAAPDIAPPPAETPAPTKPAEAPPVATTSLPTAPAESAPKEEEPPPKRIVQREGIVRSSVSIQAPTNFRLVAPDTGRTINYLFSTSPYLDLNRYKGLRIVVTGEEALDERWKNTPIITIQKIRVVE